MKVNFKEAKKLREILVQAVYQFLFNNQNTSEIYDQFAKEHQNKKINLEILNSKLKSIELNSQKINQSIDDSSYLLGYSKFRTFRKIHFPNLKNSIYLISILIAIEIIKELPITLILRPFNFETFATKAYAYASQDLLEAAALPSLFLIFWSAILIFFTSRHILSEK